MEPKERFWMAPRERFWRGLGERSSRLIWGSLGAGSGLGWVTPLGLGHQDPWTERLSLGSLDLKVVTRIPRPGGCHWDPRPGSCHQDPQTRMLSLGSLDPEVVTKIPRPGGCHQDPQAWRFSLGSLDLEVVMGIRAWRMTGLADFPVVICSHGVCNALGGKTSQLEQVSCFWVASVTSLGLAYQSRAHCSFR